MKILFCSDIEKIAQHKILEIYPDLKADIIIAPHHGSTVTTDTAFIERLEPKIIIYSGGQAQYENQMKITHQKAVRLFTFDSGQIVLNISSKGNITFNTFLKAKKQPR